MTMTVIATLTRQKIELRRQEREQELQRLARAVVKAHGYDSDDRVGDLLAFIGVIHNTPNARTTWRSEG